MIMLISIIGGKYMAENKRVYNDNVPNFTTFPIAYDQKVEEDSKVSAPPEVATEEAREWVNYKEM